MAITIQHVDGFEHGVPLTTNGGGLANILGATVPSISTVNPKSGARCLTIPSGISYITKSLVDGSGRIGIVGFHWRYNSNLGDEHWLCQLRLTTALGANLLWRTASQKIEAGHFNGSSIVNRALSTNTLVEDQWYWIELIFDSSASPFKIRWSIDGVAQTDPADSAGTPANTLDCILGDNGFNKDDSFDNWILGSCTSLTDVIGETQVLPYSPDGRGTPNFNATNSAYHYKDVAGTRTQLTTTETTSYQVIDDVPLDADTDHIVEKPVPLTTPPTFAAAGTVSITNGANPTPGIPAGTVSGDFLLMIVGTRDVTDGSVSTPSGWTKINLGTERGTGGIIAAFYKIAGGSETTPTVTLVNHTSSTSGESAIARIWKVTNVNVDDPIQTIGTRGNFAAALNIGAISGITLTEYQTVVVIGHKLDDWTSVAVLGGDSLTWTEQTDTPNTNGADNGLVVDTGPNNSANNVTVTSKTFTVTGGTSVASAGIMFALNPALSQPLNTYYSAHTFADESVITSAPLAVAAYIRANRQNVSNVASVLRAKLYDGTSESDIVNLTSTNIVDNYYSAVFQSKPSGGAWTVALMNGSEIRFGYSNSVYSQPRLMSAMLQVAFPLAVPGTEYTDSTTENLALTPTGTEEHTTYDSGTLALAFTPAPNVEFLGAVDSSIVALALVPTSSESAQLVDAATEGLVLTPSTQEEHTTYDAATETLTLTPSQVTEGIEHTDLATVALALTPSGVDFNTKEYTDANTEALALVPSGADIVQFVDASTVSLALTPSGSEVATWVDTNTEALALSPSATEASGMVDTSSVSMVLSPTATEALQSVDSLSVGLALTPSATESYGRQDAAIIPVGLLPSGADTTQYVDSDVGVLVLDISAIEIEQLEGTDTDTIGIILTISSSEIVEYVDVTTESLLLTPSSVDVLTTVDTASVLVLLSPQAVEALVTADASTLNLALVTSGTESRVSEDAVISVVVITPSGTEGRVLSDADAGVLQLSPSDVESQQFADVSTATISYTVSAVDYAEYGEAATVGVGLSPSGVDTSSLFDAVTANIALTPAGTDEHGYFDADQEYLVFTIEEVGDVVTDSDQLNLVLTITATEVVVYVEASTELLALTPTGVDYAQFADSSIVNLNYLPTANESAVGVEAATEVLALTPSYVDVVSLVDASTEYLSLSPTSTDVMEYADAATGQLGLLASATEGGEKADSDIQLLSLAPQASEGAEHYDSQEVLVGLIPSYTELAGYTDSLLLPLGLLPTYVEFNELLDSGLLALNFGVSTNAEEQAALDTGTAQVKYTPTTTEVFAGSDSSTEVFALTAQGSDTAQFVDALTIPLNLGVSGNEQFAASSGDTGLELFVLAPSQLDVFTGVDSSTGEVRLTPTTTDASVFTDDGTARVSYGPSSVESYERSDSGNVRITYYPSGTDVTDNSDSGVQVLLVAPSATETSATQDAALEYLNILPSAVEGTSTEYGDSAISKVVLSPLAIEGVIRSDTGTEVFVFTPQFFSFFDGNEVTVDLEPHTVIESYVSTDIALGTITLTPSAFIAASIITDFVGKLYRKWYAHAQPRTYAYTVEGRRWIGLTPGTLMHYGMSVYRRYFRREPWT